MFGTSKKKKSGSFDMKTHYIALSAIALMTINLANSQRIEPIPCRATENCTSILTLPRETVCMNGYCVCPDAENVEKFSNCVSTKTLVQVQQTTGPLIFRTCKLDQHCNFTGGFCNTTNSQCECSRGFLPSTSKQYCVQKINSLDSSCEDDNQCLALLPNTTCTHSRCNCIPSYRLMDGVCWKKVGFGLSCTSLQECSHIKDAICNVTCICPTGMVLSSVTKKAQCLVVAQKIHDECVNSVQCSKLQHSECINKICQCRRGCHYDNNMKRCYFTRGLDDICDDYECYEPDDYLSNPPIKSVMCNANRCTCAPNYIKSGRKCVSQATGSSLAASFLVIVPLALTLYSLL